MPMTSLTFQVKIVKRLASRTGKLAAGEMSDVRTYFAFNLHGSFILEFRFQNISICEVGKTVYLR